MVKEGDVIILYDMTKKKSFFYKAKEKTINIHCGRVNLGETIGKEFGTKITSHTGHDLYVLKPTLEDLIMQGVRRRTQVIYPKDAALIIIKSGIKPGDRVIEVGCGSGSFTISLAHYLGPEGKVYTYEKRADLFKGAAENIDMAGFTDRVVMTNKEISDAFDHTEVDFIMLDLPVPWEVMSAVNKSLKNGCRLASLLPTINQVEQFVFTLEDQGYIHIEVVECWVRKMLVRRGKTRPEQLMPSHTGYLIFATKVAQVV